MERAFKFVLALVGVQTRSLVSSVTFVVGSGIFVFEGHDLDIGNPNVEGEVLVASTDRWQ